MNPGLTLRLLLDISAHQRWEMPQFMYCVKTDSLKTSIVKYTLGRLYVVTRPGINIVFYVVQDNNVFFCKCIYNRAMKIFCKKGLKGRIGSERGAVDRHKIKGSP